MSWDLAESDVGFLDDGAILTRHEPISWTSVCCVSQQQKHDWKMIGAFRREARPAPLLGEGDALPVSLRAELLSIAIAALGGAAVGVERQRAYRENEPGAVGGLRTFTLLGTLAGACGFLMTKQVVLPATALLAATAGVVLVVRFAAGKISRDATTEMAALTVLVCGLTAGLGHLVLASALYAWTLLLLIEKSWLHSLVQRIGVVELEAAAQFAAMALIVLPLLPSGSFGPGGILNLRSIWTLVLLFSGISFGGYLARKAMGTSIGWMVAGMIGGLISSTQIAFSFARESRHHLDSHQSLFAGTMAATAVSMLRVCAVCLVLRPALAAATLSYIALPVIIAAFFALYNRRPVQEVASREERNPLGVFTAVYLSGIFVAAQYMVSFARHWFGSVGLVSSAGLLGAFDIDALVASLAPMVRQGMASADAAHTLTFGIAGNTAVKCAATIVWGTGRFRRVAVLGFTCILAGLALALFVLPPRLQ